MLQTHSCSEDVSTPVSCSEDASTPVSSSEDASNPVSFRPALVPPLPPLPPPGGCSPSWGEQGRAVTAAVTGRSCYSALTTSSSESYLSTSSEGEDSNVDNAVTAITNRVEAVAVMTGCPFRANANSGTVALEQQQEPRAWRAMIDSMMQAHKQAANARKVQAPVCWKCGTDSPFRGRKAGCERCRDVLGLHIWAEEEKQKVLALVDAGYRHWEDIPTDVQCHRAVDERE